MTTAYAEAFQKILINCLQKVLCKSKAALHKTGIESRHAWPKT